MSVNKEEALEQFLDYMEAEMRYSPNTVRGYKSDISQFLTFLGGIELHEINRTIIRKYLSTKKGYADTSYVRLLSALGSFFIFGVQENWFIETPMNSIKKPKIAKTIPVFLTNKEVKHLFETIEDSGDIYAERDKVIVRLFLATGMRVSEVEKLDMEDIDYQDCTIKIRQAKGKKDRMVDCDAETLFWVRTYIEENRIKPKEEDAEAVFIGKQHRRLKKRDIQRMVKKWRGEAGFKKQITPHKLRHTTGKMLLEGGMDIRVIQKEFGHKNLSTTEIYTKVTDEHKKKEYQQSHPFAKKDGE